MYGLSRCCSVTCPTCGLCYGTVTFLRDAMCSLHVSRRVQVLKFTLCSLSRLLVERTR